MQLYKLMNGGQLSYSLEENVVLNCTGDKILYKVLRVFYFLIGSRHCKIMKLFKAVCCSIYNHQHNFKAIHVDLFFEVHNAVSVHCSSRRGRSSLKKADVHTCGVFLSVGVALLAFVATVYTTN